MTFRRLNKTMLALLATAIWTGCATTDLSSTNSHVAKTQEPPSVAAHSREAAVREVHSREAASGVVHQASHQVDSDPATASPTDSQSFLLAETPTLAWPPAFGADETELDGVDSLAALEAQVSCNPSLRRLHNEYHSALAKARHVGLLPDPILGVNIFGQPIETAAGSQRANVSVSQMLPWLARLDARSKQVACKAAAIGQAYSAERLNLIANIRADWYRLYVLHKQIEISRANQELLETLIDVATSRVAAGQASQSDVLSATLAYSKLEEELLSLSRQVAATKARLNRNVGRDARTPITSPSDLLVTLPDWDLEWIQSLTWSHQPEIEAARIQKHAAGWGVEIARLQRRPDFTLNATWFGIEDNRPTSNIVDVGRDAWSVGAMMSLPVSDRKYDAIEQEALWAHAASVSSLESLRQKYDAMLVEQWEQARVANETAELYQATIIPEAKRAFESDLKSYSNGSVDFDRVLNNFRTLLSLEQGYHRSQGQLATALARMWQISGGSLQLS